MLYSQKSEEYASGKLVGVIQRYYLIHDCWFETRYTNVVKALPEKNLMVNG